jgi:hypothetical protein
MTSVPTAATAKRGPKYASFVEALGEGSADDIDPVAAKKKFPLGMVRAYVCLLAVRSVPWLARD